MAVTSYAIALGSNRRSRHGSPAKTLRAAFAALGELGEVEGCSATLKTPPLGVAAGREFANAVLILRSKLAPDELLAGLKAIERAFGRRSGRRWGPRVLDLDIILWSEGSWSCPSVAIPHPGIATRSFVLDPLASLAPLWRVPPGSRTVRQLASRLRMGKVDPRLSHS
jgi:2-amino-4-hydroxy-6-hydroxymethyldihydropteridine diphosphokinase